MTELEFSRALRRGLRAVPEGRRMVALVEAFFAATNEAHMRGRLNPERDGQAASSYIILQDAWQRAALARLNDLRRRR